MGGFVVSQNLCLVGRVVCEPTERWNPEQRTGECAEKKEPEGVAALEMRSLMRDYGAELF